MVISLVEALSCMDANTRSTEIAEFTDRVFIISHAIYSPVIDLTRSWRRIRCCSIFHPTKDLTTMANGSPNHVVPSSMMETFLPSISLSLDFLGFLCNYEQLFFFQQQPWEFWRKRYFCHDGIATRQCTIFSLCSSYGPCPSKWYWSLQADTRTKNFIWKLKRCHAIICASWEINELWHRHSGCCRIYKQLSLQAVPS